MEDDEYELIERLVAALERIAASLEQTQKVTAKSSRRKKNRRRGLTLWPVSLPTPKGFDRR